MVAVIGGVVGAEATFELPVRVDRREVAARLKLRDSVDYSHLVVDCQRPCPGGSGVRFVE